MNEVIENDVEPSENVELTDEVDNLEATQDEATPDDVSDERPKKSGFQKRIDELTKDKYEAQEQARFFAEQLKTKEEPKPQVVAEVPKTAPVSDDYDTYEGYLDALTDYKTDLKLEQRDRKQAEAAMANRSQRANEAQHQAVQAQIAKGREKYTDFDMVAMNDNVPMTNDMLLAITDSASGADIAYYLGNHVSEAKKIAQMNPVSAIRAMGRIEATLESNGTTVQKSNAPTPLKPVNKNASVNADPERMGINEWMQWRQKQVS